MHVLVYVWLFIIDGFDGWRRGFKMGLSEGDVEESWRRRFRMGVSEGDAEAKVRRGFCSISEPRDVSCELRFTVARQFKSTACYPVRESIFGLSGQLILSEERSHTVPYKHQDLAFRSTVPGFAGSCQSLKGSLLCSDLL